MNEIFFSLIVPVYNVSAYLKDCLESLSSQEGGGFEVLLVNDGSTDESEAICLEYAEKAPFFRYYSKENGGLSSARNFGIEKARGEYLLFIDSDDFLPEREFLAQTSVLLKNTGADLAMFLPVEFNETLSAIVKRHAANGFPVGEAFDARSMIDLLYSSENPYITMAQTKIIRREYLIRHCLYFTEGIYHEDDEWVARVLLTDPKTVLSDAEGYGYRHRAGSIITSTALEKRIKRCTDRFKIADRILGIGNVLDHRQCVTYFTEYYFSAVSDFCKLGDPAEFIAAEGPENVFRAMKRSLSKKHRLLSLYAKVFGKKAAKKAMAKKFKKAI